MCLQWWPASAPRRALSDLGCELGLLKVLRCYRSSMPDGPGSCMRAADPCRRWPPYLNEVRGDELGG